MKNRKWEIERMRMKNKDIRKKARINKENENWKKPAK